jgi:hypothetical protein
VNDSSDRRHVSFDLDRDRLDFKLPSSYLSCPAMLPPSAHDLENDKVEPRKLSNLHEPWICGSLIERAKATQKAIESSTALAMVFEGTTRAIGYTRNGSGDPYRVALVRDAVGKIVHDRRAASVAQRQDVNIARRPLAVVSQSRAGGERRSAAEGARG